jgi:hypothetical protein
MKKKAIVELSSSQDDTVLRLAGERKTYKVEIIRKLIDLLEGLSGDIQIIAYDKNSLNIMDNFEGVKILHEEENVSDFDLACRYVKGEGVESNTRYTMSQIFGGKDVEENSKAVGV